MYRELFLSTIGNTAETNEDSSWCCIIRIRTYGASIHLIRSSCGGRAGGEDAVAKESRLWLQARLPKSVGQSGWSKKNPDFQEQ